MKKILNNYCLINSFWFDDNNSVLLQLPCIYRISIKYLIKNQIIKVDLLITKL